MKMGGMGWADWRGTRRSSRTRSRARGHEHLQLQTSRYCNGPQVEQTEWRNGGYQRRRKATMRCNAMHNGASGLARSTLEESYIAQ